MGEVLGLLFEVGLIRASLRNYLESAKHEKVYAHRDILEPISKVLEEDSLDEVSDKTTYRF